MLKHVSDEIKGYEAPDFGALVREVHVAARALVQAVNGHNSRVSGWARSIRALGATDTTYVGRGGAVVADGYVQAPASISGLLRRVVTVDAPRYGVPTVSITDRSPDHLDQAVNAAHDEGLDRVLAAGPPKARVRPDTPERRYGPSFETSDEQSREIAAWQRRMAPENERARQAAALRYRRDVQGWDYDANIPGSSYPAWIDDSQLIAEVPDVDSLTKPSTTGTVLTEAGRRRGRVEQNSADDVVTVGRV